jgi:hypothetical protein
MSLWDILWPRRSDPAAINPARIFAPYEEAIGDMEKAAPSADDPTLLTQSWKIFDNDAARRSSIDTRAGAIMPAISLAATLATGVGFTVLKDTTIPLNARWIILATFVLALAYLVRTMFLLFVIQGKIFRNTPDPSDLSTPIAAAPALSPYDRQLSCKIMRYTVANYRINNIQSETLYVAQKTFRNAIITIVIGGIVAGLIIFLHSDALPVIVSPG